jgi:signal transduction histidine kinase
MLSVLGFILVGWGVYQVLRAGPELNFILLFLLALLSALPSTSVQVEKSGITYAIGSAVGMAAIPFYGPAAACVLVAGFNVCLWWVKPKDQTTWKKSGVQLAFNNGMHALSIFAAGWVLLMLRRWFGETSILGQTAPWGVAGLIYNEVNIWLLIGVLRLQHGPQVNPVAVWREDRWASLISFAVLALGGGILAFAMQNYDWVGVMIFYLPIVLSAYAFELYVRQMKAHMDNLEQIVAKRTKDLAELNRQKDAYLAILTHDMMTPLASIQLCAEELQADPGAALENPDLITIMGRSQKVLFRLVRDILDIERLQAGGSLSAQRTVCDLAQLLPHAASIVKPEAESRGIAFDCSVEASPIQIYADRQQMERIILNLIANAVKYTPAGGAVCVHARVNENTAIINVRDTGYGIPAAELPYIFDRFRRVEQLKDKAAGTGLGLAITKALVEEHQGEIIVQSEEGKGSIFTVRLPIGEYQEDFD